jgi:hypothetical protein
MPAPTAKTTYVPLVAAISSANGSIYFADADAKALLDSAPDRAPTNSTPKLADPENTALVLPADGQPVLESIALVKGMSRTELWTATFAGVLPGLQERAGTLMAASPLALFVPGEEFSAHPALRDGDRVQIAADPTNCAALRDGGDFTVTHIGLDTLDLDAGSLPVPAAECLPAAVVYSVLAGAAGPAPWVVHGTASGYAGRATAGTPFSFTGTRWHYPEDPRHIPVDPPNAAAISFVINGPAPHRTGETSSPGLAFGFAVDDGLVRVLLAASDVAQRTSSGALLPGAMLGIHAPPPPDVGPAALPRLFVAYTGSDLILEVNPGLLGVTGDVLLYR